MALQTKTIDQIATKGWQRFSLTVSEDSTNTTTNKSSISYSFQISPYKYSAWDGYGQLISYSVSVAGHPKSGYIPSYNGEETVVLVTDSFEVEHNEDGNKEIEMSFSVVDNTAVSYTPGNASQSGVMALTYIPRKTLFPKSQYTTTVGESGIFGAIYPASKTFTHSLKLTIGSSFTKYINGRTGEWYDTEQKFDSVYDTSDERGMKLHFNAKNSLYSLFSGKRVNGTLTLTTYNGDTKLGESSATFVIQASGTPIVTSATPYDLNDKTYALTKDRERIVAYHSNCRLTLVISAGNQNDTNVSLTELRINDIDVGATTRVYTLGTLTSPQIKVYMKNSRGFEATNIVNLNKWVPYLNLWGDTTFRRGFQTEQTPNGVISNVQAFFYSDYYNGHFDANNTIKNTFKVEWRYKKRTDDDTKYSDWYTLDTSDVEYINNQIVANNSVTLSDSDGNAIKFEYHTEYYIQYKMSDKLSSSSGGKTLASATPVFSWADTDYRITNNFTLGGENSNGISHIYSLPVMIKTEDFTTTNASGVTCENVVAQGLLSSNQHFVENNYNVLDNVTSGRTFLDATTMATKQNNTWKIATCWADIVYPIGSIYMNINPTNPKLLFGGEWVRFGKGRVPVSVDEDDTDFNEAGKIGGSKYLQEHNHTGIYSLNNGVERKGGYGTSSEHSGIISEMGGTAWTSYYTGTTGTGNSGNLQPYIAVYMWQRTA